MYWIFGVLFAGQAVCANAGPLISGSNPIPDTSMTASSEWSTAWGASYARFTGSAAWCASGAEKDTVPPKYYIQVRNVNYKHYFSVPTRLYTRS